MKKLVSIFLVLAIVAQTFINVGIGIYYHLNKEYISQELCINRNNPQVHCNGHCYLAKQLKKAEDQESKRSSQLIKEKEEVSFNQLHVSLVKYFPSYFTTNFIPFNSSLHIADSDHSLIKPPAA